MEFKVGQTVQLIPRNEYAPCLYSGAWVRNSSGTKIFLSEFPKSQVYKVHDIDLNCNMALLNVPGYEQNVCTWIVFEDLQPYTHITISHRSLRSNHEI